MNTLNNKLLAAHTAGDGYKLAELYAQAAQQSPDIERACFFMVHAYIFALEHAHPRAHEFHQFLIKHGREE